MQAQARIGREGQGEAGRQTGGDWQTPTSTGHWQGKAGAGRKADRQAQTNNRPRQAQTNNRHAQTTTDRKGKMQIGRQTGRPRQTETSTDTHRQALAGMTDTSRHRKAPAGTIPARKSSHRPTETEKLTMHKHSRSPADNRTWTVTAGRTERL
jgi:hypothetical protein